MFPFEVNLLCISDCAAFRDPDKGSWFIQALCAELEEDLSKTDSEKYDLLRMLTNVNRNVAFNCPEYNTDEVEAEVRRNRVAKYKQMPNFYCTLTRQLYFKNLVK